MNIDTNSMDGDSIERVSDFKVLFAHMSVGRNIIQGIEDIKEKDMRIRKIEAFTYEMGIVPRRPGIYNFLVGNNSFPNKKINACRESLAKKEVGEKFDVFIFKFCYVDFNENTDVEDIFSEYSRLVQQIRGEYPDLKVVHVTVPLTVKYKGLKGWLKFQINGNPSNEKRSRFNEKLRVAYGETDPIYDLARVESVDSHGHELFYKADGEKVNYMATEYTNDGGHLNELGRKKAALELIRTLAKLSESGG